MFPEVDNTGCCVSCGKLRAVGDFPKCPHSAVDGDPYKAEFFQDSIPGGMVIENGVAVPTVVYSHTEARMLREQNGYRMKEKWSPFPGTDVDPAGVQNPDRYKDAKTLENATILMLRAAGTKEEDIDLSKVFRINDSGGPTDVRMTGEYKLCPECQGNRHFTYAQVADNPRYQDSSVFTTPESKRLEAPVKDKVLVDCLSCEGSGLVEVGRGKHRRT